MATGDRADLLSRLKAVLPQWFGQLSPIVDAVMSAPAQIGSWAYGLMNYAQLQTRVATATDSFLDLAAFDFFGLRIKRRPSQEDDSFRAVIRKEVLRPRATRPAMQAALEDLTGTNVQIFEPYYPHDTGGWDTYGLAFDQNGGFGSRDMPYQMLIHVDQPIGAGVPNVAGLDTSYMAWDGGYASWIDISAITGPVTDQDIYDTVEATRAAGVTCWVNIGPPIVLGTKLAPDFALGRAGH